MVNDEPFPRTEQLVGDNEGTDGVITRPSAGVADDMRIALTEACVLCRIEPGIHARQDGEVPSRRKSELALPPKARRIFVIGCQNLVVYGHWHSPSYSIEHSN